MCLIQIKSPEGMFVFLECITYEAGLSGSSWFIEVKFLNKGERLGELLFNNILLVET